MTDSTPATGHPYQALGQDQVIDAVEATGLVSDLRVLALNSYENRVYQVGIEGAEPVIAKFYRPDRWTAAQILEEHAFCAELVAADLPVVAPWTDAEGRSLFTAGDFFFSLFPRRGGHAPEPDRPETLYRLGRLLGRLHRVGRVKDYRHRPALTVATMGQTSLEFIAEHCIPLELRSAYVRLGEQLLATVEEQFAAAPVTLQRIHGDAHLGNILMRGEALQLVDFDDSRMGPPVQDLWMLLSGSRDQRTAQLQQLLEGYRQFNDFAAAQLSWIEGLRTLRRMHYAAWLGRRWQDPAFPRHFPWFGSERYWSDHILQLREQLATLEEPPLAPGPFFG